nr:hypothetical protein [Tanacetum cinerariifolium]
SADPVTNEARPSYDSDILSKVQDHDHYQDVYCAHHEEHAMHDNVQLNHVVNSHADYTRDSYMTLYDQYVKDNVVPVVHSNVSNTYRNTVVGNSLTVELATYKEHVKLYERRASFELTEREQKINEQLRLVISDRNFKEETLKKELHSVKLQLASTINHNKSMVEEVTFLKKDFKQRENKYLEEFLDMKALKENVKDRLFKQDQSLQTVHMLCRPKPYYNELNKVAIGYNNLLCLTHVKQVHLALYNGHEIIKDNYVPTIVHNTDDTLEIAKITRRKMKDPECVTHKVKIETHDYLKENFLATFTPQKQLTPEQIFWSQDLIKLKSKALKEQTTASRPIEALTVYPPSTPATLVPRVLPMKSQVKIIFLHSSNFFQNLIKPVKRELHQLGSLRGKGVLNKPRNVISKSKDLEILFQPMFDEYLEPPRVERPVSLAQAVQAPVNSAGTPSSTTTDQDAPSLIISPSSSVLQSDQGVAAESTFMEDNLVAPVDNNPFINVFSSEPSSGASSSGDVSSTESTYVSQTIHHLSKRSKDHPLDNVIGNPS